MINVLCDLSYRHDDANLPYLPYYYVSKIFNLLIRLSCMELQLN